MSASDMTPDLQALIEPCPFCGSTGGIPGGLIPWVQCDRCEATGPARATDQLAITAWNTRQTAPTLPGAGGGDALDGMFSGLQSDLAKLTIGARLIGNFENMDWNQQRESLEGRVITAASALMAHTEAAGMTLDKDGISIRIAPIAYEGEAS